MKIVKLMGGMGNQMFQYAFGQMLGADVKYDYSWFEEVKKGNRGTVRDYELGVFSLTAPAATEEEVRHCLNEKTVVCRLPGFLRRLLGKKKKQVFSNRRSEKQTNVYEPELLLAKGDVYYEGYFQCEQYFADHRGQILRDFSLKVPLNEANEKMLEKIRSCQSVSLHVRRGDYTQADNVRFHGLCSLDYYRDAIDYVASKVERPEFFLFSDDVDWVKDNLKIAYPYTVVDINDGATAYFDLECMKNCKHNIIANSSFSWWGAWLNENPEKIVVAPQRWFAGARSVDVVPESWKKI